MAVGRQLPPPVLLSQVWKLPVAELAVAGGKVALVLSILDRGEGARELYAAAGVPFKSLFRADEFLRD